MYSIKARKKLLDLIKREGIKSTARKIFERLILIPIRGYINYSRWYKYYPQNIIFIAGYAKSGSTWIANMFAGLNGFEKYTPKGQRWKHSTRWDDFSTSDLYPGIFLECQHRLAVIKSHTWGSKRNVEILNNSGLKYIITVRDPRDKIISGYYYIRNHPKHWDYERAITMSLEDYITYKFESGEFEQQSINWLRMWINNYDKKNALIIKYEDAIEDTFHIFRRTLDFLNFDIAEQMIHRIIEKNSFKSLSGRKRGEEDRKSFYRKGVLGEWKNVFTTKHKELFKKIEKGVIERLDYPPTN